ncbi:hypothetical protein IKW75_00675 [Candidatus Saccharibacteria bacterium]|nr:hypothetical protein [Candidatus Saccharibacteria bacterium]
MSLPAFEFVSYNFDEENLRATFNYRGGNTKNPLDFTETVTFPNRALSAPDFDSIRPLLDRAMFLAFITIGTSYYKAFPTKTIKLENKLSPATAEFFNAIYQDGLSQFAFENKLERKNLAHFASDDTVENPELLDYSGEGKLVLQSGGKDSLLTATLLSEKDEPWTALYISSNGEYPKILNDIGAKNLQIVTRKIDLDNLLKAKDLGGKNGHVPVTYINIAIALIQAILNGQNEIITSIGREGEELHSTIESTNDEPALPVNHQWSKTKIAEDLLNTYVEANISPKLKVYSIIREYSELKIAELFATKCWDKFGHRFSSCNRANYSQGINNSKLYWCGDCAKCANSYLLFAPFIPATDQNTLFRSGQSLFKNPHLVEIFKGLLGVDGVMKPFECIGEVNELREAYHQKLPDYPDLPFKVPPANKE